MKEGVQGQVGVLEGEVGEVRAALTRSQQECYAHHASILHLQKEVGRLQGETVLLYTPLFIIYSSFIYALFMLYLSFK